MTAAAVPPLEPQMYVLLVMAAFCAGLIDSIAGGGGLVAFPALLAAGLPPHLAIGTNKGQAVFGAISSAASFWHGGGVERARAPVGFALGFAGAIAGALTVLAIRPDPLRPIIVVLLAAAAGVVLLRGHVKPAPRTPKHPEALVAAIGFALGFYDGFFGPGTGSMLIVAFVVAFGDTLTRASGNAKIVNLASNLASVLIFALRGQVLWAVSLPMAGANALGAAIGSRLALRRGDALVRWVVVAVAGAAALKLALTSR